PAATPVWERLETPSGVRGMPRGDGGMPRQAGGAPDLGRVKKVSLRNLVRSVAPWTVDGACGDGRGGRLAGVVPRRFLEAGANLDRQPRNHRRCLVDRP